MAKPYGKPTSGPAWWAAFLRQKIAEGWTAPYDGGLADGYSPSRFDIRSLAQGIGVEREHTRSDEKALRIAMDHLSEDPCYYDKLSKMEANPLGNLPAKASRMWEHVYASAQERGMSKSASAAQAWCAVKRQYYKKGDRWRKRKTALGREEYPPGCTPFRGKNTNPCCDACEVGKACTANNPSKDAIEQQYSGPYWTERRLREELRVWRENLRDLDRAIYDAPEHIQDLFAGESDYEKFPEPWDDLARDYDQADRRISVLQRLIDRARVSKRGSNLEDWLHDNAERFRDDYGHLDEEAFYDAACEKFCRKGLGRYPQEEDPEFSGRFYSWVANFGPRAPEWVGFPLTKLKNKLLR